MTKTELFAGATGIVGLLADVITIFEAVRHHPSPQEQFAATWITAFVFSIVYGWFVLSWLLVRWNYSRQAQPRGRRKLNLDSLATRSVFTVGALVFPFAAYVAYSAARTSEEAFGMRVIEGVGGAAFAMGIVGCTIYLALSQGMPLIYDDIR